MDNRLGRIAGIAAYGLMIIRLSRLLESGRDVPAWHLIMIASAFLGGVIWWLLAQTITSRRMATTLFAVAGLVLFLRIAVPRTLFGGFLPMPETFGPLVREMGGAIDLIRFGVAPVFPTSGVVAILSGLMWLTGGLFVWGASRGSTSAMVLPSLGLYIQFAVMDRLSAGRGWMAASAAVIGLSITALAMERRAEAGRVRNAEGHPIPRRTSTKAFVLAAVIALSSIVTASAGAGLVPLNGNFRWRVGSGYGPGGGGVAFDRLADLQQRIIQRSNAVMFTAVLDESAPPAGRIYWRMESLDVFDGTAWRPSGITTNFFEPGRAGGDSAHRYRGTSQQIAARVKIDKLRSEVVPTAGFAYELESDTVNTSVFQVTRDGSLIYQPGLNEGDQYVIEAVLPLSQADLGALATGPNGDLSPLFANATEAGAMDLNPAPVSGDTSRPVDIDRFLEMPVDVPVRVLTAALTRTVGATTDFERAWLLQHWFRDSGDFTYSTSVTTGHGSLDLERWLTDATSLNYRTGYCEQFAASMAVLGRALGIPSRVVWGFTPGTASLQSDGTEIIEVRDNNAHAWVEMWMDGFGWVEFDPTPRGDGSLPQSATAAFDPAEYLPPPNAPALNPDGLDLPGRPELPETDVPSGGFLGSNTTSLLWLVVLPAIATVLGMVPAIKSVRRRRRLARLRMGDITAAWDEIIDRLADLGQPIPAFQTPLEFAGSTDPTLIPLADHYSAAIYGGRSGMGIESDLLVAEDWLRRRYEGGQRARAAFNPRSLFDRD
jgi:transglutaminase-like putative cysteine protease